MKKDCIYIHIPFCVKKCIYCDFYSVTDTSLIPGYIKALEKEIRKRADKRDKISTLYFGGGTPSLVCIKDVELILQVIKENFSIAQDAEVTFEINPGTIDLNYLTLLKKAGINRLSIGVQSFNDDKLKFLKRIHSADQAVKTVENGWKAGFSNISLDMIYGLGFETRTVWQNDMKKGVKMNPCHLSCYMLTNEKGTPFDEKLKKGLITALDKEFMADLFKITSLFLEDFKYEHYEISSFSKGFENRSRHNSKYWDMIPYYGFGASAHSYDGEKRFWNHKSVEAYIKDIDSGMLPVQDQEILTLEQKMVEMIMLRLRTLEGLDLEKFQSVFHISFTDRFTDTLDNLLDQSLGFFTENRFALTLEGKVHLDNILEIFSSKIF